MRTRSDVVNDKIRTAYRFGRYSGRQLLLFYLCECACGAVTHAVVGVQNHASSSSISTAACRPLMSRVLSPVSTSRVDGPS